MALLKNIINPQGVTATYHRLNGCSLRFNLNHTITANIVLTSYLNAATRQNDNQPVLQTALRFNIPIGTAIDQNYLYDQVKTLSAWSDAVSDIVPLSTSA